MGRVHLCLHTCPRVWGAISFLEDELPLCIATWPAPCPPLCFLEATFGDCRLAESDAGSFTERPILMVVAGKGCLQPHHRPLCPSFGERGCSAAQGQRGENPLLAAQVSVLLLRELRDLGPCYRPQGSSPRVPLSASRGSVL